MHKITIQRKKSNSIIVILRTAGGADARKRSAETSIAMWPAPQTAGALRQRRNGGAVTERTVVHESWKKHSAHTPSSTRANKFQKSRTSAEMREIKLAKWLVALRGPVSVASACSEKNSREPRIRGFERALASGVRLNTQ